MLYWITYPFIRILLALVSGMLLSKYSEHTIQSAISVYHILFLFSGIFIGQLLFKNIYNIIWGNLLLFAVCLIGLVSGRLVSSANFEDSALSDCQAYIGVISSPPVDKEKFLVFELDVTLSMSDSIMKQQSVKVQVQLRKVDSSKYLPQYGDKILIDGQPKTISPPKNPFAFNYGAYLANQGILFQHFVLPDKVTLIAQNQSSIILTFIYKFRSQLEHKIALLIPGKEEHSIVKALLLGIKSDLAQETKSAYAAAGAMHILAVSGLHVSVVYFMIQWLFSFSSSGKVKRWVIPSVSIVALWTYAILTGLSPSILRAVTMISIIISSKMLNRRTHIFNTLAFAAFVLLIYNPNYLNDVGFQLSFLAVSGIVYLYPKISTLWEVNNWLVNKIWQLTCVSLAAQIATFPISIYYFHQFPTYFLFTNIIVIPAAFIIMILAMATLLVGNWIDWFGSVCEFVVFILNEFVVFIENADGSVINNIAVSPVQVLFIYCLIIACLGLFLYKKFRYAGIMGVAALVIASIQTTEVVKQYNRVQLVFYSTRKNLLIDEITGYEAKLISTDFSINKKTINYTVDPLRVNYMLQTTDSIEQLSKNLQGLAALRVFHGKKILFINSALDSAQFRQPVVADITVISNQAIKSMKELNNIVSCPKIILDASNGYDYCQQLLAQARKINQEIIDLNKSCHIVGLSGNEVFLDMFF